MIIAHYVQKARPKYIPGTGSIVIMVSSFIISLIYQTIAHRGNYEYSLEEDIILLLGLAVFFITYALLVLEIISIRQIIMALTISILPFLVYSLYSYYLHGELSKFFILRFGGTSPDTNPNYVATVLDFCFPFALFLALGEKKAHIKIFFSLLSMIYCICLLLTAARGSIPGLLAILLFFIFKSRSIAIWILIGALTIGIFGTVGSRVANRILKPTTMDNLSNIGRVELATTANSILKNNYYMFGIGFTNFKSEKFRYGFSHSFDNNKGLSTHNSFLELWVGWGLLGLIGWLSLLIGSLIRVARTKLSVEMHHLRYALMFALLGFMAHGIVDVNIAHFNCIMLIISTLSCISFLSRLDVRNSVGVGTLPTKPDF
jgi:O-antigen ligase